MHIRSDPSFFLAKRTGAPQLDELGRTQPFARYLSSYDLTSASSDSLILYYQGFGGGWSGSLSTIWCFALRYGTDGGSPKTSSNESQMTSQRDLSFSLCAGSTKESRAVLSAQGGKRSRTMKASVCCSERKRVRICYIEQRVTCGRPMLRACTTVLVRGKCIEESTQSMLGFLSLKKSNPNTISFVRPDNTWQTTVKWCARSTLPRFPIPNSNIISISKSDCTLAPLAIDMDTFRPSFYGSERRSIKAELTKFKLVPLSKSA